jgi:hypothetical protein
MMVLQYFVGHSRAFAVTILGPMVLNIAKSAFSHTTTAAGYDNPGRSVRSAIIFQLHFFVARIRIKI